MVSSFIRKAQTDQQAKEAQIKKLHAKIGQLPIENDVLQKAFAKMRERREDVGLSIPEIPSSVSARNVNCCTFSARPITIKSRENLNTTWS